MDEDNKLYDLLGVSRTAADGEIKKVSRLETCGEDDGISRTFSLIKSP